MLNHIKLARYEVVFEAGDEGLLLPPYKGSTLRGGFGKAFQRMVCSQRDKECHQCLLQNTCPYSYIFETAPPPGGQVLRKYENIPRPFVLEPPLETKTFYSPGEKLAFQLVLLGKAIDYLPYFIIIFRELGQMGIGKGRKNYRLDTVNAINLRTGEKPVIYNGKEEMVTNIDVSVTGAELVDLCEPSLPEEKPVDLTIRFLTMTRLKFEQEYTVVPEFHIIIRNLLRRLSSISYFHHGVELDLDFRGLIEKAREVTLINRQTRWEDWERYSSRQNARMNLGGIVGEAVYRGNWQEFWPLLKLAEQIHVGKGTVFGLGKVEMIPSNLIFMT
ncbi:MAG: CRISPR system precrRNA processing endoribonuclease RAMP protein Cas6 [Thermincolia bacterium]